MKKAVSIFLAMLASVTAVTASSPFSELYVSGPCEVVLVAKSDSAGIVMAPDANSASQSRLEVRRNANAMYIDVPASQYTTGKLALRVYCTGDISLVSASGRSVVDACPLRHAGNLTLLSSGPAKIKVADISAGHVNISVSGSGRIDVTGKTEASSVNLSLVGSGRISAVGIDAAKVSGTLRGSGRMTAGGKSSTAAFVVQGSGMSDCSKLKSDLFELKLFGTGRICYPAGVKVRKSGDVGRIEALNP